MGLFTKRFVEGPVTYDGEFGKIEKDFLSTVDENQMLTFQKHDMSYIARFVSRPLYMSLYNTLVYERPEAAISRDFKKTTWTKLFQNQDGSFAVKKSVTFDKVGVSKQLKLSVANDYSETWYVKREDEKFTLMSIEEVCYA